jgi:uncharacterized protein YlxW (UPF0749 family)
MSGLAGRVRAVSTWQATLFIALLVLGFLIAAQARSETPRVRYTTQERAPLIETALGLQAQQDALQEEILRLRAEIAAAERGSQGSDSIARALNDEYLNARIAAGLVPLEGPGLVLQLEDSAQPVPVGGSAADYLVTGQDVKTLVEELWLAGAEAVAVNDERVTPATAIIDIGGSVLVNSAYLAPPYQVKALGPTDLYDRLSASAGFRDFVVARARTFGIRLSFAQPSDLVIPAYAGNVTLRYARPVTEQASPSPGAP